MVSNQTAATVLLWRYTLWTAIRLSRFLPLSDRDVVDKCIQQNAYYGHPENVLLNMMIDKRKHIRQLAVSKIRAAREAADLTTSRSGDVRQFTIPKLSFQATDYILRADRLAKFFTA